MRKCEKKDESNIEGEKTEDIILRLAWLGF